MGNVTTLVTEAERVLDSVYEVAKETAKLDNPVLATAVAGFVLKVLPIGIPADVIVGGVVAVGTVALAVQKYAGKLKEVLSA